MQQISEQYLHFNKELGEIIKELRLKKEKISIYKFAAEFGIDRGNFSRIENGIVSCKFVTVWKISEALNMKCSELVKILEEKLGDDFKLIDE